MQPKNWLLLLVFAIMTVVLFACKNEEKATINMHLLTNEHWNTASLAHSPAIDFGLDGKFNCAVYTAYDATLNSYSLFKKYGMVEAIAGPSTSSANDTQQAADEWAIANCKQEFGIDCKKTTMLELSSTHLRLVAPF